MQQSEDSSPNGDLLSAISLAGEASPVPPGSQAWDDDLAPSNEALDEGLLNGELDEDLACNSDFLPTFLPNYQGPPVLADPQVFQDLLGITDEDLKTASSPLGSSPEPDFDSSGSSVIGQAYDADIEASLSPLGPLAADLFPVSPLPEPEPPSSRKRSVDDAGLEPSDSGEGYRDAKRTRSRHSSPLEERPVAAGICKPTSSTSDNSSSLGQPSDSSILPIINTTSEDFIDLTTLPDDNKVPAPDNDSGIEVTDGPLIPGDPMVLDEQPIASDSTEERGDLKSPSEPRSSQTTQDDDGPDSSFEKPVTSHNTTQEIGAPVSPVNGPVARDTPQEDDRPGSPSEGPATGGTTDEDDKSEWDSLFNEPLTGESAQESGDPMALSEEPVTSDTTPENNSLRSSFEPSGSGENAQEIPNSSPDLANAAVGAENLPHPVNVPQANGLQQQESSNAGNQTNRCVPHPLSNEFPGLKIVLNYAPTAVAVAPVAAPAHPNTKEQELREKLDALARALATKTRQLSISDQKFKKLQKEHDDLVRHCTLVGCMPKPNGPQRPIEPAPPAPPAPRAPNGFQHAPPMTTSYSAPPYPAGMIIPPMPPGAPGPAPAPFFPHYYQPEFAQHVGQQDGRSVPQRFPQHVNQHPPKHVPQHGPRIPFPQYGPQYGPTPGSHWIAQASIQAMNQHPPQHAPQYGPPHCGPPQGQGVPRPPPQGSVQHPFQSAPLPMPQWPPAQQPQQPSQPVSSQLPQHDRRFSPQQPEQRSAQPMPISGDQMPQQTTQSGQEPHHDQSHQTTGSSFSNPAVGPPAHIDLTQDEDAGQPLQGLTQPHPTTAPSANLPAEPPPVDYRRTMRGKAFAWMGQDNHVNALMENVLRKKRPDGRVPYQRNAGPTTVRNNRVRPNLPIREANRAPATALAPVSAAPGQSAAQEEDGLADAEGEDDNGDDLEMELQRAFVEAEDPSVDEMARQLEEEMQEG